MMTKYFPSSCPSRSKDARYVISRVRINKHQKLYKFVPHSSSIPNPQNCDKIWDCEFSIFVPCDGLCQTFVHGQSSLCELSFISSFLQRNYLFVSRAATLYSVRYTLLSRFTQILSS